jgi:hypothetical protein
MRGPTSLLPDYLGALEPLFSEPISRQHRGSASTVRVSPDHIKFQWQNSHLSSLAFPFSLLCRRFSDGFYLLLYILSGGVPGSIQEKELSLALTSL